MAVAIAISIKRESPSFAARAELLLSDPKMPSTLRPFHALARQPRHAALPMVERDSNLVREIGAQSIHAFVEQLRERNLRASRAVIVSDGEPRKVDNPHLEAHREERRLFREAIAEPTRAAGIIPIFLAQDEVDEAARSAFNSKTAL